MSLLTQKLKPTSGLPHLFHMILLVSLPIVAFILVRLNFVQIALVVVALSKWRMFSVRPRFWLTNIRSNSVDLTVGLSIVLFMGHSGSMIIQLLWTIFYVVWLLVIKPAGGLFMTSMQAFIAQFFGLTALYLMWAAGPIIGLTFLTGQICFFAARHFLDNFDEPYARMLAYFWGYFGAALAWLFSHRLLFYGGVAQPTLLLSTLGYGLAVIYYLDHNERLSKGVRRQFIFIMLAIVLVVLVFSDWGDKAI